METRRLVAFLGPPSSYTHQAALETFTESIYGLTPCQTIEDIFHDVQHSQVFRGVVPFENSSNGAVIMTLDLFADLNKRYPDIEVTAEVYVNVHHCLLGRHLPTRPVESVQKFATDSPTSSGNATPTVSIPHPVLPRTSPVKGIGHIRKLYSHPQAWGQCKTFLAAYLKGVERQDVSSTSKAAEIVSQDMTGTSAAISSGIAAKVHGLEMLAKGIEDHEDNTTRFFILKRRTPETPASEEGLTSKPDVDDTDKAAYKSLVSFTVPHKDPGALAAALAVFKSYQLNLTSINARPSGVAPWHYVFFVEFHGKKVNGPGGVVNNALRDLEKLVDIWRWLGSWESRLEKGRSV